MKYYYRLKEDGTFLDYTSFEDNANVPAFIKELYTETDREIIVLTDGSFAFKDTVDLEAEAKRKAEKEFAETKKAKLAELKNIRDTEEVKPIAYNGNLFDYDDKARERINAAIIALSLQGEGASIDWTTADNADVKVTANDLRMVIATVAVRSNELHAKYRALKEQVLQCTNAEEVAEIVW